MNPRASDRVRGFQDTIIVVGDDRRISVTVGATLGAEILMSTIFQSKEIYLLSSLVKRVIL